MTVEQIIRGLEGMRRSAYDMPIKELLGEAIEYIEWAEGLLFTDSVNEKEV